MMVAELTGDRIDRPQLNEGEPKNSGPGFWRYHEACSLSVAVGDRQGSNQRLTGLAMPHTTRSYPQLRLAALMNFDTRMLVDAAFGPYSTSEQDLAEELWVSVGDHSRTFADRGFSRFTS